MIRMDAEMQQEATRFHAVLKEHSSVIRTALHVYVERMEESAKKCEAAYKAGQEDPEVKAQQDASYITNNGLRHLAEMSRQSAESARQALTDLLNAELGPEEDEDDEQG
ncbi:hypothetical protein ABZ791_10870 [Streptomyces huasconensis]|uniref:Uncharacterized protein n=1 Tax=Streptomyces huasconensis TaxID=1854574 RepID=A0ABV3LQY3_9ACTN